MQPRLSASPRADAAGPRSCPEQYSADSLFSGGLICHQPKCGYRFSVDAVLLAHFITPRQGWRILDLGCGCGIISLIIAYRFFACSLVALENQPVLAELARSNAKANGFEARIQVLETDLRSLQHRVAPESFDCILSNPPYFRQGRGRISQEEQAAMARHDLSGTLADFVRAAAFAVKNRGRVAFIFPASGQARLQRELLAFRLVPKRLQMVYSYPAANSASLVLVEAMKNGGEGCEVMPPFYIYEKAQGAYSEAMQAMYQDQEERCWPKC